MASDAHNSAALTPLEGRGVAALSQEESAQSLDSALDSLRDQGGRLLRWITDASPTLVVLLRHTGCTFCRQTLADLAAAQDAITKKGMTIVVVGMSPSAEPLRKLGEQQGLSGVAWVADPERSLYRALGVGRGSLSQVLGWRVLRAGILAFLKGHGIGRVEGDPFQLPGTAVIYRGKVVRRYIHRTAADRPDYETLACPIA